MMYLDAGSIMLRVMTEAGWSLFLQLYRDELVLQCVAEPFSDIQIRQRFDGLLQPWRAGDLHWLGLMVEEKQGGAVVGICGFSLTECQHNSYQIGDKFFADLIYKTTH